VDPDHHNGAVIPRGILERLEVTGLQIDRIRQQSGV